MAVGIWEIVADQWHIKGRGACGAFPLSFALDHRSHLYPQEVCHDDAGKADIEQEFTSKNDERFILHDSQGYEPGNYKVCEILDKFIKERGPDSKRPIAEKIDVIWYVVNKWITVKLNEDPKKAIDHCAICWQSAYRKRRRVCNEMGQG